MTPLVDIDQALIPDEVARVRAALREELGDDIPLDSVKANSDLVFASFPNIGTAGALLERATGRVHILGSGNEVDDYVWAYYRGFDLTGENRLRITAVYDADETVEVLKRGFSGRWLKEEIAPRFNDGPIDLELEAFSFYCMLCALPTQSAFDYEVNPS